MRADVELDIPETTSLAQAHLLAHDAEQCLVRAVPKLTEAVVHAYPVRTPPDAENTSHPRGRPGTGETWAVGGADPGR